MAAELPPGFTLDAPAGMPALPPGFKLDGPAPAAVQPSTSDTVLRNTALGGGAVGEGVAGVLDLPINVMNAIAAGANKYLGASIPHQYTPSELVAKGISAAGGYTPDTPGEQLASAGVRGISGALTGLGALSSAATAANVVRAATSGATGGLSAEYVKQRGGGPVAQIAAGLAGGLAPGAAEESVRGAGRLVANAFRPLTVGGQDAMAGQILSDQATNPQAAAANLSSAQPIIPGSPRNAGEASQDVGLLALEKGLRGRNTAAFGQRISEQNAARQAALGGMAGTEADVAAAQAARDAQTSGMRTAALNAGGQADVAPVIDHIESTLAGPIGKRDVPSQALTWLKNKLSDSNGAPETDPAKLYAVRQDIGDALAGKLGGEQSKFRLASGQLIEARKVLDDSIEQAAPGFKAYLQRYSDMSKPIDQMQAMQEIQKRSELTSIDPTTQQPFMGIRGFSSALDSAINDGSLTPPQIQNLKAIKADMQLGQAINSPLIKAPGSDTYQNLSIAQILSGGSASAHPILRAISKPLQWVYKLAGSDDSVNETLTKAMLDPKLAADLLSRATPGRAQALSTALRQRLLADGVGPAVIAGANSTQSP